MTTGPLGQRREGGRQAGRGWPGRSGGCLAGRAGTGSQWAFGWGAARPIPRHGAWRRGCVTPPPLAGCRLEADRDSRRLGRPCPGYGPHAAFSETPAPTSSHSWEAAGPCSLFPSAPHTRGLQGGLRSPWAGPAEASAGQPCGGLGTGAPGAVDLDSLPCVGTALLGAPWADARGKGRGS